MPYVKNMAESHMRDCALAMQTHVLHCKSCIVDNAGLLNGCIEWLFLESDYNKAIRATYND